MKIPFLKNWKESTRPILFFGIIILVSSLSCFAVLSKIEELDKVQVFVPVNYSRPDGEANKVSQNSSSDESLEKFQLDLMNRNLVEPLKKFTQHIDHWERYRNEKFGFAFEYPNTYINIEGDYNKEDGHILSLMAFNADATSLMGTPNPGYFTQMTMSYWDDINNEYLRGGSWEGERKYSNFQDFLSDSEHTFIEKVGETTIGGEKAYILLMPGLGQSEAVMFEHKGGYYRIDFQSDMAPLDKNIKEHILSSFQLL